MNAPSLTHSFPTFRLGPLSRMPTFQNKAKARMFIRWIPIIGLAALAVYALLFGGPLPSREEDQEPTPPTSAASPPASPAPPPSAASVLDKWLKPARQPTIDPVFSGDPPHSGVYCKMVNEGDFETSWFKETEPWNGPASRKHRKQHEMAYIPYVVQQLGLCGKNKRGLVFAAGREPLPSLFACQGGCSILATDFDPAAAARTGWTSTGQWSGRREELFRDEICKNKTFFDDRVEYRTADMNHIDPALHGQFDFVWSTCSVEHVGSILLGQRFVLNSLDLLKPGGVAIHTVEFTLSDLEDTIESGPTVLWRKKDAENVFKAAEGLGHQPFPVSWGAGTGPLDQKPDLPPYKQNDHIKLIHAADGKRWIMTSFGMIIRKGGTGRP